MKRVFVVHGLSYAPVSHPKCEWEQRRRLSSVHHRWYDGWPSVDCNEPRQYNIDCYLAANGCVIGLSFGAHFAFVSLWFTMANSNYRLREELNSFKKYSNLFVCFIPTCPYIHGPTIVRTASPLQMPAYFLL